MRVYYQLVSPYSGRSKQRHMRARVARLLRKQAGGHKAIKDIKYQLISHEVYVMQKDKTVKKEIHYQTAVSPFSAPNYRDYKQLKQEYYATKREC